MHLPCRPRMWLFVVIVILVVFNFSTLFTDVVMTMTGGNTDTGSSLMVLPEVDSSLTVNISGPGSVTPTPNEESMAKTSNFSVNVQPIHNSSNADQTNDSGDQTFHNTTPAPTLSIDNPTVSTTIETLSACLLVKDENDGLNEWIAYHYHLWNLRQLVVAMDPTSQTSPRPLLDQWSQVFSLHYVLWEDSDYMPPRFLQGDASMFKQRLGKVLEKFPNRTFTAHELQQISNHNNRQREFLRKCYAYFDNHQHPTTTINTTTAKSAPASEWIVHIDVDEYLSWNPLLLRLESTLSPSTAEQPSQSSLAIQQPTAGFMMDRFQQHHHQQGDAALSCILIPRLLFGGVEDTTNRTTRLSPPWNTSSFESIRWKYHAPLIAGGPLNGPPKALLNWKSIRTRLRHRHALLQGVFSIHRPSKTLCPKSVSFNATFPFEPEPSFLAIRHFLGSLERYMSRQDARRSIEAYQSKANLTEGPIMNTSLDNWIEEFVQDHGLEKVTKVLRAYQLATDK